MWKYVGQRLRDGAEQTCSHLKNLRSTFSTCNTNTVQQDVANKESLKRQEISRDERVFNSWTGFDSDAPQNQSKNHPFDCNAPYIIQKCYQKQKQKQQDAFNGWTLEPSLLQWVSELRTIIFFNLPYLPHFKIFTCFE